MAYDNHIRRGHPTVFALIIFFSIVEGALATWLTVRFNQHHNYLTTAVRDRARFLTFTSWWTVLFCFLFLILFQHSASKGSALTSIGSHGLFLLVTWILWTAGAASITAALGGGYNCSRIAFAVPYCNQLNALEGFAWAVWILVTFALLFILIRGATGRRNGTSLNDPLVTA